MQIEAAHQPQHRRVVLLGATGSIGSSALSLIEQHPDRFSVLGLTAHQDVDGMLRLIRLHRPTWVAMACPVAGAQLDERLAAEGIQGQVQTRHGDEGLCHLASLEDGDLVVAGIVGFAGLSSVLSAAASGKIILLANKEALVCAGPLLIHAVEAGGATLLPIDSEHNAIFQCLGQAYRCFETPEGVHRLILTASGGPFRTWSAEEMAAATREQALKHPNWVMGQKITIDSATLMNKALEVLEAHWLFDLPGERIEVVVHPESIIHSMVEFVDGSTLAQLGPPDMRVPIAHALAWPQRIQTPVDRLDWQQLSQLRFEPPDPVRFPSMRLVRDCLEVGCGAATLFNTANEVAVEAFLQGRIRFGEILATVEQTLQVHGSLNIPRSLEEVQELGQIARTYASSLVLR